MQVRPERTGWRDEHISQRHRLYGWDCPGVDLDFVLVEYHAGKPAALVEYKAVGAAWPNLNHPTYRALRALADAAGIPLLLVFYNPQNWHFRVTAANRRALETVPQTTVMTERQYVALMYRLRGLTVPTEVAEKLNS